MYVAVIQRCLTALSVAAGRGPWLVLAKPVLSLFEDEVEQDLFLAQRIESMMGELGNERSPVGVGPAVRLRKCSNAGTDLAACACRKLPDVAVPIARRQRRQGMPPPLLTPLKKGEPGKNLDSVNPSARIDVLRVNKAPDE